MSNIVLRSVTIRNFLQVGAQPVSFPLDTGGITLIRGENGAGKSQILQAVFWALFNESVEGNIKQDDLINNVNSSQMRVELSLDIDNVPYQIIRGRKPAVLSMTVNGEPYTPHSSRNFDEEIVNLLGFDAEIARNTLLLDANVIPFMRLKGSEQRDFMEKLLNLKVLTERAEVLKKLQSSNKDSLLVEEAQLNAIRSKNESIQKSIKAQEGQSTLWESKQRFDIDTLQHQIDELAKVDIEGAKQVAKEISLVSDQLKELQEPSDLKFWEQTLSNFQKHIKRIGTVKHSFTAHEEQRAERLRLFQQQLEQYKGIDFAVVTEKLKSIDGLAKDKLEIDKAIQELETEYASLEKDLAEAEQMKEKIDAGICPTCLQKLHVDILPTEVESIPQLKSGLSQAELSMTTLLKQSEENMTQADALLSEIPAGLRTLSDVMLAQMQVESAELGMKEVRDSPNPFAVQMEEVMHEWDNEPSEKDILEQLRTIRAKSDEVAHARTALVEKYNELKSCGAISLDECERVTAKLQTAKANLAAISKSVNPNILVIEQLSKNLTEVDESIVQNLHKLEEHYKVLIKLLTDSKGFIRRNLVGSYVGYLNQRINQYLQKLGSPHVCEVNSDLTLDLSYGQYSTSYGCASKGEKLRLNFATNQAFRDLLELFGVRMNILLIDEYLDAGGDNEFLRASIDILSKGHYGVHLITHRDTLDTLSDRVIHVSVVGGFSEYNLTSA